MNDMSVNGWHELLELLSYRYTTDWRQVMQVHIKINMDSGAATCTQALRRAACTERGKTVHAK